MKMKHLCSLLKAVPNDFLTAQQQTRASTQQKVEGSTNLFSPQNYPVIL